MKQTYLRQITLVFAARNANPRSRFNNGGLFAHSDNVRHLLERHQSDAREINVVCLVEGHLNVAHGSRFDINVSLEIVADNDRANSKRMIGILIVEVFAHQIHGNVAFPPGLKE
jgi:hypothetical protein